MAILSSKSIIPKALQGITLVISEVIPCEDLEMSYQRMILDIVDLLIAPWTDDSKATSKDTAKAQRPHGGTQGEGSSWPPTPQQILDIEDSQVGEGSSELVPPPYTCDFIMEGASLPSNEGVRPWLDRHGNKMDDSVGKTLLLPMNMENWKVMDGKGMLFGLEEDCGVGKN